MMNINAGVSYLVAPPVGSSAGGGGFSEAPGGRGATSELGYSPVSRSSHHSSGSSSSKNKVKNEHLLSNFGQTIKYS